MWMASSFSCRCRSISTNRKSSMAIDYRKDVDGFHPINVGRMAIGLPCFISATPLGILDTALDRYHIETIWQEMRHSGPQQHRRQADGIS